MCLMIKLLVSLSPGSSSERWEKGRSWRSSSLWAFNLRLNLKRAEAEDSSSSGFEAKGRGGLHQLEFIGATGAASNNNNNNKKGRPRAKIKLIIIKVAPIAFWSDILHFRGLHLLSLSHIGSYLNSQLEAPLNSK